MNKKELNILLVDDHPIFRKGLSNLLITFENIASIDEASNGIIALEKCASKAYDFVFLDIEMPEMNGEETTKALKLNFPTVKIVIVTMSDSRKQIIELLKLKVDGYISKTTSEEELAMAIELILDGNQYLTANVKEIWYKYVLNNSKVIDDISKIKFSEREIQIIGLIADQLTTKEIANKVCLSESTINNHKGNIMAKIGTDNAIGIVMYAIKNEIYIV